jgi:hypothetical protein
MVGDIDPVQVPQSRGQCRLYIITMFNQNMGEFITYQKNNSLEQIKGV